MRDDIDLHLAKRVFQRRRELNLTQRQLGQLCGVTFQQVQKYECGANRISAAMIWRLSEALGVQVQYFYDGLEKTRLNGADATGDDHVQGKMSDILGGGAAAIRAPFNKHVR